MVTLVVVIVEVVVVVEEEVAVREKVEMQGKETGQMHLWLWLRLEDR